MNKSLRVLVAVGMWTAGYILAVYLIPSIRSISRIVDTNDWLSNGEISQVTFLILSMLLIFILARGDRSAYGLRLVRVGQLLKPVAMAIGVSLLFFVLTAVVMMISGPPAEARRWGGIHSAGCRAAWQTAPAAGESRSSPARFESRTRRRP